MCSSDALDAVLNPSLLGHGIFTKHGTSSENRRPEKTDRDRKGAKGEAHSNGNPPNLTRVETKLTRVSADKCITVT